MDRTTDGWISGFTGMVIFSGSLPATRVAVTDFDPVFLTGMRATIAGVLALALIGLVRVDRPRAGDLLPLALVSAGVVIGFPLLTALALQHINAAHSVVFIGLCRWPRRHSGCCGRASDRGRSSGCSQASAARLSPASP